MYFRNILAFTSVFTSTLRYILSIKMCIFIYFYTYVHKLIPMSPIPKQHHRVLTSFSLSTFITSYSNSENSAPTILILVCLTSSLTAISFPSLQSPAGPAIPSAPMLFLTLHLVYLVETCSAFDSNQRSPHL